MPTNNAPDRMKRMAPVDRALSTKMDGRSESEIVR
jgi:hypothetical protein